MTVMPTYVSEIAPLELRGAVGVLCPLGVTFGVVFAQVMGLPQVLGEYCLLMIHICMNVFK